ncbi:hypothetical protein LLG95_16505, partial [bacterium]|nr:hypothetical protein [bacterium]
LPLLSTSPRGDAVAVDYGPESVCPEGTCTLLDTHPFRRTSAAACCRFSEQACLRSRAGSKLPSSNIGSLLPHSTWVFVANDYKDRIEFFPDRRLMA